MRDYESKFLPFLFSHSLLLLSRRGTISQIGNILTKNVNQNFREYTTRTMEKDHSFK